MCTYTSITKMRIFRDVKYIWQHVETLCHLPLSPSDDGNDGNEDEDDDDGDDDDDDEDDDDDDDDDGSGNNVITGITYKDWIYVSGTELLAPCLISACRAT